LINIQYIIKMFITIRNISNEKFIINKSHIIYIKVIKKDNLKYLRFTLSCKETKRTKPMFGGENTEITTKPMSQDKIDKILDKLYQDTPSLEKTVNKMSEKMVEIEKYMDELKEQMLYIPEHGDGYKRAKAHFDDLNEPVKKIE
jgi:thiamine kinase-like enzyme